LICLVNVFVHSILLNLFAWDTIHSKWRCPRFYTEVPPPGYTCLVNVPIFWFTVSVLSG
jgi:hypothetical protein